MLSLAPAMCLSTRAKALAQYLLNTPSNRLPSFLQPYVPFLQKLFLGAAASAGICGGIYYYLQRGNQAKLQLAIFHVLRILEKNPHLAELLQDPALLATEMEVEVLYMVGPHLTEAEGDKVFKELKRKVRNDEVWPHRQVRRVEDGSRERRREENLNDSEYVNVQPLFARHTVAFVPTSNAQPPSTPCAPGWLQNSSPPAPYVEDEDDMEIEYQEEAQYTPEYEASSDYNEETPITPYIPPVWQKHTRGRGTGKAPSVSSEEDEEFSSQPTASAPALANNTGFTSPTRGYGFEYDDWSTDEDNSPSSSKSPLPSAQIPSSNKPLPSPMLNNLIDSAMESAFNPNSPGNQHLPLSAFAQAKACGVKIPPKRATLRRSALPRTPPTQAWLHKNRQEILTGTDLSPIEEGDSLVSDKSRPTKHCVAETSKFDIAGEAQRTTKKAKEYQPAQNVLDSPAMNRQIQDLQQEIDVLQQGINDDEQAVPNGLAAQKSKAVNAVLTSSLSVVTPNKDLGQILIEAAKIGTPSPKTTIGDLIVAAGKSGTPPVSQSPKTIGTRTAIRAFFRVPSDGSSRASDLNLPAPVPSPSKKKARVYQQTVDEPIQAIFESESVDSDEVLQKVLAKQFEADKCAGEGDEQNKDAKSPIDFRGPNVSGSPPVAISHSSAVAESSPPSQVVTRVSAAPRSPKVTELSIAFTMSAEKVLNSQKALMYASEKVSSSPPSQNCAVCPVGDNHDPLITTLSPDASSALTENPAVSVTSSPPKRGRGRGRPPKTTTMDKMSKGAGVSKGTPGRPPKTPRNVSVESVGRRSTRKTSYKGKFQK